MQSFKWFHKTFSIAIFFVSLLFISAFSFFNQSASGLHVIRVKNPKQLQSFFRFTDDRIPFISSHRGGPRKGFPENCIATFENTLQHTWSVMEVDPRYTKDSAIVLMHDATLNRTSNGQGKVSDYTLDDIRKLKLKDTEGNLTSHNIPTLDETLEWAKGKTILLLDSKDVPVDARVQKIKEHNAQTNAMIMAYTLADAKRCFSLDKNIMMELVFVHDLKSAKEFDMSGIPWKNVVVFVTHTEPKEKGIFEYIHSKGAMCIRGSSRTIDRDFTSGKILSGVVLNEKYQQLINEGADIIEADLGIEAGLALKKLQDTKSNKRKYFKVIK